MGRPRADLGCPYDHVICDPSTGCWTWLGYRDPGGYGKFGKRYAHRLYYELFRGEKIPDGLHVDHLCRNRACVNPDHLEPVTPRENILRGVGAAAMQARKTHCDHGHEFSPENTRVTVRRGKEYRMCIECNRRIQREQYARRKREGTVAPSHTAEARARRYKQRITAGASA